MLETYLIVIVRFYKLKIATVAVVRSVDGSAI